MPFNMFCRMLIRFNSKQHAVTRRMAPTRLCATTSSRSGLSSGLTSELCSENTRLVTLLIIQIFKDDGLTFRRECSVGISRALHLQLP
jgi:hypothetical protein